LLSPPQLTRDGDAVRTRALKEWQKAKVFDAFMMQKFPPTLSDEKDFNSRPSALIKEVGGRFIIATLPVGKEGWETSGNKRMAETRLAPIGSSKRGSDSPLPILARDKTPNGSSLHDCTPPGVPQASSLVARHLWLRPPMSIIPGLPV
jgi:hypothetical protein